MKYRYSIGDDNSFRALLKSLIIVEHSWALFLFSPIWLGCLIETRTISVKTQRRWQHSSISVLGCAFFLYQ